MKQNGQRGGGFDVLKLSGENKVLDKRKKLLKN